MKKGTKLASLLIGLALIIPACSKPSGETSKPDASTSAPTPSESSSATPTPSSSSQAPAPSSSSQAPAPSSSSQAPAPSSSSQAPAPSSSSQAPSSSSEAPINYEVSITNKDALQAEWSVGDQGRKVEITTNPRANIAVLISEGKITITSSDTAVAEISGQMVNPVGAGTATIKVKSGNSEDTVAVTITAKQTAKEKYGTTHEGTLEDPFDNEDAIKVANDKSYNNEDFYVKGVVESFYHAAGVLKGDKFVYARNDGACSYFLQPATAGGEKFEVYKAYKKGTAEASYLTDDDIWVGGTATAHGTLTVYKGQAETTAATFVSCEGTKPNARQIVSKTFAEVMTAGSALADGSDSWDFYKFQAYVTAKEGNNYWVTATKGEELVKGKSDKDHQEKDIYTNAIELYFSAAPSETMAGKLLEGAKVEITMIAKNYHGTVENLLQFEDADITVIEAGEKWKVPEPTVTAKTIAEFKALENKADKAYKVTAKVKSWKNETAAKDKYGNMVLTDGENDLTIYGATVTETALAWDNASSYAFTNPQDFLTNEQTAALAIGDTVEMKLIRADYDGAIQGKGVITKITPDEGQGGGGGGEEQAETVVADFSQKLANHNAYNDTWTYGDFTISGGANNNGSWAFVKMGGKSATISAEGYPGTWIKTNKAVAYSVESVTFKFVGKCYNQDNEKATVKVESYSDAALATKVAETPAQEVPAITTNEGVEEVTFTFATAQAANLYYKINFDIVNTTTYNGVVAIEKITFNDASSETPVEIAQPKGKFFAAAELGEGKSALGITANIAPIFIELGDNNAVTVNFNAMELAATIKSYDKATGNLVITAAQVGDVSMTWNPETACLEKLAIAAAPTLLKWNGGQSLKGNDQLKHWSMDGTDSELQAQFDRRYGSSSWTTDETNANRIVSEETAKRGKAARVLKDPSKRYSLATKDFSAKFKAKNLSFWVYNDGEAAVKIQIFGYKSTGWKDYFEIQSDKEIQPGWTFFSRGFTETEMYGFQIIAKTDAVSMVYDDICLF